MSEWINIRCKAPPEGKAIDVWQGVFDSETGKLSGTRIANCWFDGKYILHGKPPIPLYYITHWKPLPEPPKYQDHE